MGPPTSKSTPAGAAAKDADEVEVKLRLPDAAAAAAAAAAFLRGGPHARPAAVGATHAQENFFFDGAGGELSAARCVLRLRFASTTPADGEGGGGPTETAVLTLKGQQVLSGGIGVAREVEAPLADARAARRYVSQPGLLAEEVLQGGSGGQGAAGVLRALQEGTEGGRAALARLVCLGGFRNTRREVAWEFFSAPGAGGAADAAAGAAAAAGADAAAAAADAAAAAKGAAAPAATGPAATGPAATTAPRAAPTEAETGTALLELDETAYEWGTVFEVEAEAPGAAAAERVRDALERTLAAAGVPFSRSGVSKFRNFIRRTLE
jgi:adenylate cyclase class IV